MGASIEFRNVAVRSPSGAAILSGVSLAIAEGEAVAFIGRSGAGKTTALRLVNGLTSPSAGEVLVGGVPIQQHDLVALRRRIGMMSQGVGLFPHRTVFENVATVPRLVGWDEERIALRAAALLGELGMPMERFGPRYPRTLSGGEQQRVGIARALAAEPEVVLCDEPFASLDPIVRTEQQQAFLRLRHSRALTMIFVTHDLTEALTVADRLVLFGDGTVVADCAKGELLGLEHPLAREMVRAARLREAVI